MKEQPISFETAKLAHEKGYSSDRRYEDKGGYVLQDCTVVKPGIPDPFEEKWEEGKYFKKEPYLAEEDRYQQQRKRNVLIWAPTQAFLQKWLRKKHNLYVEAPINTHTSEKAFTWKIFGKRHKTDVFWCLKDSNGVEYSSYEEALEEALKETLTLIEN